MTRVDFPVEDVTVEADTDLVTLTDTAGNVLRLVGSNDDLYVFALRLGRATGAHL